MKFIKCRWCKKCGELKKHHSKGLCYKCYLANYYQTNRNRLLAFMREYGFKNRQAITEKTTKWRKANPDKQKAIAKRYAQKHRTKYPKECEARQIAYKEIKIPHKQPCQICISKFATQRHHYDYNQPRKVIFVCPKCHKILDKLRRKGNRGGFLSAT